MRALSCDPNASGLDNAAALQAAADRSGVIRLEVPGVYRVAKTVLLDDDTELHFAPGVVIEKVDEQGPFMHVFLNRGALDGSTNRNIAIHGLNLRVNGVDSLDWRVFGLRGQIAFLRVNGLAITGFRCLDLGARQFAVHVCTFCDVLIEDIRVHGKKDGVHLGRGRGFVIREGRFRTFDDAIALNGHDYDTSNPELGWIENGLVEDCTDLSEPHTTGYFCRLLGGGWPDWSYGLSVRKSDTVVYDDRLYRVRGEPNGESVISRQPPTHRHGCERIGLINWQHLDQAPIYTAGVRNVIFRDIQLRKERVGFSFHLDNDRYSRSWRPGSPVPVIEGVVLESVQVMHNGPQPLIRSNCPVGPIRLDRCKVGRSMLKEDRYPGLSGLGGVQIVAKDTWRKDPSGELQQVRASGKV